MLQRECGTRQTLNLALCHIVNMTLRNWWTQRVWWGRLTSFSHLPCQAEIWESPFHLSSYMLHLGLKELAWAAASGSLFPTCTQVVITFQILQLPMFFLARRFIYVMGFAFSLQLELSSVSDFVLHKWSYSLPKSSPTSKGLVFVSLA